ncbi:MAG: hypothetical protein D6731_12395 [Planctomycetota bacterium]|nr:MAG: hypothetical protein D6731_12395 [Planctomycetota bacterium]
MTPLARPSRLLVFSLPLLLAPAAAQDAPSTELERLRVRLREAQERLLEESRRRDEERRRYEEERARLLRRLTELEKKNARLEAKVKDLEALLAAAGAKKPGDARKPAPDPLLDGRRVTLRFSETPVSEVVAFLRDITGANFVLQASVPRDLQVDLSLQNATLRQAIEQVCAVARRDGKPFPLRWKREGEVFIIERRPPRAAPR